MLSLPSKTVATSSINSSRWGRDATSQTDPVTQKPKSRHSQRQRSSWVPFLAQVWTDAPNAASSSTIACLLTQELQQTVRVHCIGTELKCVTKKFECGAKRAGPDSSGSTSDEGCLSLQRPSALALCFRHFHSHCLRLSCVCRNGGEERY